VVVGIGISSPLKYLLEKIKHFKKSFVIFFVKKWCYWELFGNIREHKTYQGRWKGRKVGKSKENLLLLPDTHTHLCLRHGAHTSKKVLFLGP
jgi:hypothetical protein